MRKKHRAEHLKPPTPELKTKLKELGLDSDKLWWGPMAFTPVKIAYLIGEIEKNPPKKVLDVGSGSSTIVLGLLAKKHGFDVVSIENFDESANYVRSMLQKHGAQDRVKLFLTPLARSSYPDGRKYWWYDLDWGQAGDGFDYVVVDGPMSMLVGRNGALPQMKPHLAMQHRIYMDDARRKHEQGCVVEWKRYFPNLQTEVPATCPRMLKLWLDPVRA